MRRVLDLVQMTRFADRPASRLSGGQQQRIAVARAIAFSPTVLLFDEPLSNLDAKLRTEMRVELRELQRRLDITSVYVTHDQEEALAISDRVIVMNHGRIEQIGSPEIIYNRPESMFVADFVGAANLITGQVDAGVQRVRNRRRPAAEGGRSWPAGQKPHWRCVRPISRCSAKPEPGCERRAGHASTGGCSMAISSSMSSTGRPGS